MTIEDQRSRNRLLIVLFVGVLMGALDIAIVGPALPAIRESFALDDRAIAWVFTAYVLASVVGAFYYLRIVKVMYFDEPEGSLEPMPRELGFLFGIAGLFVLVFFIYPAPVLNAAQNAAAALF